MLAQVGRVTGSCCIPTCTAAPQALLPLLPLSLSLQTLAAECGLTPACTTWRASQPNAAAAIASYLDAGAAALTSWLAAKGTKARLCAPADASGLLATARAFPLLSDDGMMGLPRWLYALIINGNLSVRAQYLRTLRAQLHSQPRTAG